MTDPHFNALVQKNAGIQPPIKDLGNTLSGTAVTPFTDHDGQQAVSAYWGKPPQANAPILPPQWSFQVYVTFGTSVDLSTALAERLLIAFRGSGRGSHPVRLDIYFMPGADTKQCKDHYRAERAARQPHSESHHFVDPYTEGRSHMKLLVQVDAAEWRTVGATIAMFDQISDYDDDDEPLRSRTIQAVPWSGPGETVGTLLHSMAAGTGQDELNDAYHQRLSGGHSRWM